MREGNDEHMYRREGREETNLKNGFGWCDGMISPVSNKQRKDLESYIEDSG